jgi:transcriptional regulator with XRE-family HTH domain
MTARAAASPNRLREFRLARKSTIDAIAYEAEVGSTTVWRIENGRVLPNRSTMRALAAALGESVDVLFPPEQPEPASDTGPTTSNGRAGNAADAELLRGGRDRVAHLA